MKKVINVKEIMIILISVMLIAFTTNVLATDVLGGNDTPTTVDPNEYQSAQQPEVGQTNNITSNITNNSTNNSTNNNSSNNTVKKYNTNNSNDLPQTGIEDYNIGILIVICVASAIYAYKKVNDYKNI